MPNIGTVTAARLNLRDAPVSGAILRVLENGTELEILDESGGWLHVRIGDDTGFVSVEYVEVERAPRKGRVTASRLNVRTAPGGERMGSLSRDTEVYILEERDGWLRVDAGDEAGWVSGDYVSEDREEIEEESTPDESTAEFRVEGRDVYGPDGTRFARTYRLGVFNSGKTSIAEYVAAHRDTFPGFPSSKLNVMQAVSENEGNLEAINTWDSAFLTFGCFQWTVGTGDGAGELAALLDRLHREDTEVFGRLFGQFGLGLADVRAPASEPPRGYLTLDGEALRSPEAKERLREMVWAYRFTQAGLDDTMRRVEVGHAADRLDLFYRSERKQIRGKHVGDYVTSEYGVALLLDQHVNRPGHVPRVLAQAVDAFVEERGGRDDPEIWGDEDEGRLLEIYVDLRNATSMTDAQARADRTRAAVTNGLASSARGSFLV